MPRQATHSQNEPARVDSDPAASHPLVPVPRRIARRKEETHDTFTIELERSDEPEAFQPGQFNMVYLPGAGDVPISVSGAAGGPFIHTIRTVGSITGMLGRLEVGDFVGLRGPFGSGWPLSELEGRDVLVLAGGVGLAPLRPVVYHLLSRREAFGRFVLLYGARTPRDLLFRNELRDWHAWPGIDLRVTVDFAGEDWTQHVGVITTLIPAIRFDPGNAVALVCGPEAMMHFTARELHRRGLKSDRMYVSMERNMKCAVGLCGHCQYGPSFVCKDGPVFRFDRLESFFPIHEF